VHSRVLDGDTIEVLRNNRAVSIWLNGIDFPEKGQAYEIPVSVNTMSQLV